MEQGIKQGAKEALIGVARNLLGLLSDEQIAAKTGLPLETIAELRNQA
jgi:hypothetical protein